MPYPIRRSLKNRRAVVIGSDVAGLAAALALTARGARVVVLEREEFAMPATQVLQAGAFKFDSGPVSIASPGVLAEIFSGVGHRLTDFLTMQRLEPIVRCHLDAENYIDFHGDEGQTVADWQQLGDGETRPYENLFSMAGKRQRAVDAFFRQRGLWGFRSAFSFDAIRAMSLYIPRRSDASMIEKLLPDEKIRRAVLSLRAITGVSPFRARGGAFFAAVHESIAQGGWQVVGGAAALREALLRLCEVQGIKILTGVRPERIELRGGAARRVQGAGFKPISASIVVSCDSPEATLRELLPPEGPWSHHLQRWARQKRPLQGRFTMLLGIDEYPEKMKAQNVLATDDALEESRSLDRWGVPAAGPSLRLYCAPKGTGFAPDGQAALIVSAEMPGQTKRFVWSRERTDEYRHIIFDRLKQFGFKYLEKRIAEEYTVSPQGTGSPRLPGFSPHLSAVPCSFMEAQRLVPNRLEEVGGLYFAGSTVHPGGGFTRELLSGLRCGVLAASDAEG